MVAGSPGYLWPGRAWIEKHRRMKGEERSGTAGPVHERRSGRDRRRSSGERPPLRYLLMGKRRGPRRAEDRRDRMYVEVYGTRIFVASISLVFLATLDAILTLHHIERGAREMNPTMNFLLGLGTYEFFYVKYAFTCLAVLFLCIHKNFPRVREVLIVLILVYMCVIFWHIYLLAAY